MDAISSHIGTHTKRFPRAYSKMCGIVDRCFPWRYGNDYLPALLATRTSGANRGRLHLVPMPGWDRLMHFVSAAEVRVAVWVIYQPDFVECLENRPCLPIPGYPVLDGHPLLHGQKLPSSSGTAELARRLGIKHPMTVDDRPPDIVSETGRIVDFYPIISDLLCLLKSGQSLRAVNLFIKKRLIDLNLDERHGNLFRIERAYHAEAAIPTVKICEEQLHPIVTNNLVRVAKLGVLPKEVSKQQLAQALVFMQDRIFHSAPVTWCTYLQEELGLSFQSIFRIFHYGILRHHLRVELREVVAMDRIHKPEKINFAADFASRFLEPML